MLALLTSLEGECGHIKLTRTNKMKKHQWHWDTVHQQVFDIIKGTIAKDVILAYPNFSKTSELYTGAFCKQLDLAITQSNHPLAFFCRKLSLSQQKI